MLQSEDPLLGDYLDEWLERRRTQLRPTTLRGYRSAVDCYVKPTLGSVPLSCVDRRTLEQLYARLLASGGLHGKPLSPRTVRLAHAIVRRALADAVLDGLLDGNPAATARPPEHDPGETELDEDLQVWTVEQVAHFLEEVDDHPLHARRVAPGDRHGGTSGRAARPAVARCRPRRGRSASGAR